jgi:uncharacterized membrane protein
MGTQQLLLIVLGVIIVGIAIAVGITIFNNQSYNSNQQAVSQELNTYASMVVQWWKTPTTQGGAGQDTLAAGDAADIAEWCGFPATGSLSTDSGKYIVTSATAGGTTVVLTGCGTETRGGLYPEVVTTINLTTSNISSAIGTDVNGNPAD